MSDELGPCAANLVLFVPYFCENLKSRALKPVRPKTTCDVQAQPGTAWRQNFASNRMYRTVETRHGRSCGDLYGSRSRVLCIAAIPASMAPEMAAAALSGRKSAIQTTLLEPSSLAETCTDAL